MLKMLNGVESRFLHPESGKKPDISTKPTNGGGNVEKLKHFRRVNGRQNLSTFQHLTDQEAKPP